MEGPNTLVPHAELLVAIASGHELCFLVSLQKLHQFHDAQSIRSRLRRLAASKDDGRTEEASVVGTIGEQYMQSEHT